MLSRFFSSRKKKNTASLAKERLQIIVAHARAKDSLQSPDFLAALQRDILEVVRKYIAVGDNQVKVAMEKDGDSDIFELNIILNPEDVEDGLKNTEHVE